ncbi:MAG: transglutaminase-like domain-containing protein [Prevotellaceae bacterium]|jgi:regulator of sirC expression with transglutaminase-like and TPR domain|nr:transglutaminase-like domain-containing protein [Prevotellaceae bacterium]
MRRGEVSSLISLLDDSDSEIALTAMNRLCAKGEVVIPELERAWQECIEELLLVRIEQVIAQIRSNATLQKLKEWVDVGAEDLFHGACYMAKLLHGSIACEPLEQTLDGICRAIWVEFNSYLTALEKVNIINHILFNAYRFRNNGAQPDSTPDLFLIDSLLQSKVGNSVALSTLYLCIAERLKLPIKGLDMPCGIMLAYLDEYADDGQSLFYIYPFFRGQVLGKEEVELIVNRNRIASDDQHHYLRTCSNRQYVCKLAETLRDAFSHAGQLELVERMNAAIKILES